MESTSSAPTSPGGKQAQRLGHRPMLTTWDAAVIVLSLIWTLVNRFAFSSPTA